MLTATKIPYGRGGVFESVIAELIKPPWSTSNLRGTLYHFETHKSDPNENLVCYLSSGLS